MAAPLGSEVVTPELVYLRPDSELAEIRIAVDGEEALVFPVAAARGSVPLPPMAAGPHRIEVTASAPADIFLNHVEDAPATLLRRSAIRLSEGEVAFEVEKRTQGEELLIGQIFPQVVGPGRQSLRVNLEVVARPIGPHESWTLSDRLYSIRLGPEDADVAILGAEQIVGPPRTMFISLGSDLPAGRYSVTIALDEGPEVYLVLSRTIQGLLAQRAVVQE